MVFAATIANRWFVARRGLVMGILTAAGATGQLIFLPVMANLVEYSSWRAASLAVTIAALAVVPFVIIVLRDYPADRGVRAYGAPPDGRGPAAAGSGGCGPSGDPGAAGGARTRTFWALAGGFAICGATTNGLIGTHFVPSAHDHGMAETTAAGLLALVGIFDIVGTIVSGCAHRPDQPADPAGRLLLLPRRRAAGAADAALGHGASEHAGLHRHLRPGLGRDGAADRGAVPAGLRRRTAPSCSAGCSRRTRSARRSPPRWPGLIRDTTGQYTIAWFGAAGLCAVAAAVSFGIRREPLVKAS